MQCQKNPTKIIQFSQGQIPNTNFVSLFHLYSRYFSVADLQNEFNTIEMVQPLVGQHPLSQGACETHDLGENGSGPSNAHNSTVGR